MLQETTSRPQLLASTLLGGFNDIASTYGPTLIEKRVWVPQPPFSRPNARKDMHCALDCCKHQPTSPFLLHRQTVPRVGGNCSNGSSSSSSDRSERGLEFEFELERIIFSRGEGRDIGTVLLNSCQSMYSSCDTTVCLILPLPL